MALLKYFKKVEKELEKEDKDCSDIPFIYSIIYGTNVIMKPCLEQNFYRRNLKFCVLHKKTKICVTSKIFTFTVYTHTHTHSRGLYLADWPEGVLPAVRFYLLQILLTRVAVLVCTAAVVLPFLLDRL